MISALIINYCVLQIINPWLQVQYPSISYTVHHAVGIDTSNLLVARTGVRGSNDLVWVGRSANYAAKLSSLRPWTYRTFITPDVYNELHQVALYGLDQMLMWSPWYWSDYGITIYRSSYMWNL